MNRYNQIRARATNETIEMELDVRSDEQMAHEGFLYIRDDLQMALERRDWQKVEALLNNVRITEKTSDASFLPLGIIISTVSRVLETTQERHHEGKYPKNIKYPAVPEATFEAIDMACERVEDDVKALLLARKTGESFEAQVVVSRLEETKLTGSEQAVIRIANLKEDEPLGVLKNYLEGNYEDATWPNTVATMIFELPNRDRGLGMRMLWNMREETNSHRLDLAFVKLFDMPGGNDLVGGIYNHLEAAAKDGSLVLMSHHLKRAKRSRRGKLRFPFLAGYPVRENETDASAEIIELPAAAFDNLPADEGRVEKKDRSAGIDQLDETHLDARTAMLAIFEEKRGKYLFGALKKAMKEFLTQGTTKIDMVKILHSCSDGQESGNGAALGRLILETYKIATADGKQSIRLFLEEEYRGENLRGSIKNPLVAYKEPGKTKSEACYPFAEMFPDNAKGAGLEAVMAKKVAAVNRQ